MTPDNDDYYLAEAALDAAIELDGFRLGRNDKFDKAMETGQRLKAYIERWDADPAEMAAMRTQEDLRMFGAILEAVTEIHAVGPDAVKYAVKVFQRKLEASAPGMNVDIANMTRDFCLGLSRYFGARYHDEYEKDEIRRRRYA